VQTSECELERGLERCYRLEPCPMGEEVQHVASLKASTDLTTA
jgi:hypothetical protein